MLSNFYKSWLKPIYFDAKQILLDTLFPINCLVCGTEGAFVCEMCKLKLTKLKDQHCIVCEKPSVLGLTHPGCLTPHCADGLVSLFNYHDENVAEIIIKGKYSFLPGVYAELGLMLARELSTNYQLLTTNYYLIPLPLHKRRKRWRGFNQAEVLCQAISKNLGLPVLDALLRQKSTKTQKDVKKREDRFKNVSDAFTINPNLKSKILNHQLILVDDVTTTGSTLLEAAKVLKRNGAAKVWCLTVARD